MMPFTTTVARIFAVGLLMAFTGGAVLAQQPYPSRPIRLVIPFPPDGGTDVVSRIVAAGLTKSAGWSIVADHYCPV